VRRTRRATLRRVQCSQGHMRRVPLLLFCAFYAVAVFPQAKTAPKKITIKYPFPPDTAPQYSPAGVFHENPQMSYWEARWFASELRSLGEPSLLGKRGVPGTTVYRFTLIPSFTPTFVVRLVIAPDGTGTLHTMTTPRNRRGGGERECPRIDQPVTAEQVREFLSLLEQADFWNLDTCLQTRGLDRGLDGEEWLLEGVSNGKYHVVQRWCPSRAYGYRVACQYLLDLSLLYAGQYR